MVNVYYPKECCLNLYSFGNKFKHQMHQKFERKGIPNSLELYMFHDETIKIGKSVKFDTLDDKNLVYF